MKTTKSMKSMLRLAAAGAATLALAVGMPLAAQAATASATVNNTTKTWSPTPVYGSLAGAATVSVSGSGFIPSTGSFTNNGIYLVFGGSNYTATNDAYYHDSKWIHPAPLFGIPGEYLLTSGSFTNVPIDLVPSYTNGDSQFIDCKRTPTDTTAGREQCYLRTMSAHGAVPNPASDPNYTEVPVYFE